MAENNDTLSLILIAGGIIVALYFVHRHFYSNKTTEPFEGQPQPDATQYINTGLPSAANQLVQQQPAIQSGQTDGAGEVMGGSNEPAELGAPVDYPVEQRNATDNCYPNNVLTASDLLPIQQTNVWSEANPMSQGSIASGSYLQAGFHYGTDTISASRKNPSYDLRGDIINPQNAVSPWLQSTIQPDLNRRAMSIGPSDFDANGSAISGFSNSMPQELAAAS